MHAIVINFYFFQASPNRERTTRKQTKHKSSCQNQEFAKTKSSALNSWLTKNFLFHPTQFGGILMKELVLWLHFVNEYAYNMCHFIFCISQSIEKNRKFLVCPRLILSRGNQSQHLTFSVCVMCVCDTLISQQGKCTVIVSTYSTCVHTALGTTQS